MGDMADMVNEMSDEDIEDEDPFLMDGTGDYVSEDFHDYVNGTWRGAKHPSLMSRDEQKDEMTRLRHELHTPHKDDLDVALEQSHRVLIVGDAICEITKKFGKPFNNVGEMRTRLSEVDNQIKDLTQEREFLKQQIDNWTGESYSCPKCGKEMKKRNGKFGEFWGCGDFPNCNGTRKIDANV